MPAKINSDNCPLTDQQRVWLDEHFEYYLTDDQADPQKFDALLTADGTIHYPFDSGMAAPCATSTRFLRRKTVVNAAFDPNPHPGKVYDVDHLTTTAATSEILSDCAGIEQVPLSAIQRIGAIFAEGEAKYGRDNWRAQGTDDENKAYTRERYRHARRHLQMWFEEQEGYRTPTGEDHLAKVGWFVVTTIERERLEAMETEAICKKH